MAERRPVAVTRHGHTRVDDYAWLRDQDQAVIELLRAENAWAETATAHLAGLRAELFAEFRARIIETDATAPVRRGGWWYRWRTQEGLEYPRLTRATTPAPPDGAAPDAGEAVVLDLNELAAGHDYLAVETDISPDGRLLAYSLDTDGSEVFELRIRDLTTGQDLPDVIADTSYGTAWVAGGRALWFVRADAALRPFEAWVHELGGTDQLAFREGDERFELTVGLSRTDALVQVELTSRVTSEVWLADASVAAGGLRVVEPRHQDVEYTVEVQGDRLLIVTNADDAYDGKLVQTSVRDPGRAGWREVTPHRPGTKLEAVVPFEEHVVRLERHEGRRRVVIMAADGSERCLAPPEEMYALHLDDDVDYHHRAARFSYSSPVTPPVDVDVDLATGTETVVKRLVVTGHDPGAFRSRRIWATAPDGTQIPISVVHRDDLEMDGSHPTVLYGYGAYEQSVDPAWSSLRPSLLARGVVHAVAHVRGGGEFGRRWWEAGRLGAKPTTFSDFLACAEHLVADGYTSPERLAIRGASAGGLLIGAVVNLRPDLFRAAVAEVPFVDALNTILDPSLPLTVTEWEEWGNPVEDAAIYDTMASYSPVDNVHDAPYPAVLATAGLNDPRVSYWEPAKWVQRLRRHSTSGRPVLLKVELGAGHGGPSGRYEAWAEEAFIYAFLLDQLATGDDQTSKRP